jgi:hypothetical protein
MTDDRPTWFNHIQKVSRNGLQAVNDEKSSTQALIEVLTLARSVTEQVFGDTPAAAAALPAVLAELLEYDYEDDRLPRVVQPTLFEDDGDGKWLR